MDVIKWKPPFSLPRSLVVHLHQFKCSSRNFHRCNFFSICIKFPASSAPWRERGRFTKDKDMPGNSASDLSNKSDQRKFLCAAPLLQGDTSRCAKPHVDFTTKVPLWPGQTRPGQNGTFVLKSTGGFAQRDVSPCTGMAKKCVLGCVIQPLTAEVSQRSLGPSFLPPLLQPAKPLR